MTIRGRAPTLHALTLIQPWAWAIAHAGKDVENRTWAPPEHLIGSDLAIHAGAKPCDEDALYGLYEVGGVLDDPEMLDPEQVAEMREAGDTHRLVAMPDAATMARSAVVCVARLTRIERRGSGRMRFSPWYCGPVGWCFDNVRALAAPVPCKGAQGLWTLPPDVEARVREQVAMGAGA